MYIGCGGLSIINTEEGMRIFLMTTVGFLGTTCDSERVKLSMNRVIIKI